MLRYLLVILVVAVPNAHAATTLDRLEASVNSSLILTSDVSKFRETLPLRAQLDPLFGGTPIAAQGPKVPKGHAVEFLIAGATAVQIGTASFYDPLATVKAVEGLSAYCQSHAVEHVRDLVGTVRLGEPHPRGH